MAKGLPAVLLAPFHSSVTDAPARSPSSMFRALLPAVWHDPLDGQLTEALELHSTFCRSCGFAVRDVTAEHTAAERIEVWFQDEARVGQKGRMVRRWFQRGMRQRMVKDQRYRSAYISGAVCSARDTGTALVLTHVSGAAMNLPLEEVSSQLPPGRHAANDLRVPPNMTLVHLPPYSPELNAIERVWQHPRDRHLLVRLLAGEQAIVDACCVAGTASSAKPAASDHSPISTGRDGSIDRALGSISPEGTTSIAASASPAPRPDLPQARPHSRRRTFSTIKSPKPPRAVNCALSAASS
jgi:hypothetical protein